MANNDSTKRVPLELLCMLILKEGDRYGYEMVQEIESRSGGLLSFNLASVYVALRRLEERGCVSSRTEMTDAARARMRVYYHLEPAAVAHHNTAGLHLFARLSHCGAEYEREHEHGQHNCRKHERALGSAALKSRCKALRCTGGRTKNVIRHRFCVGNLAQKALHAGGLTLLLCARAAYRPIHTA